MAPPIKVNPTTPALQKLAELGKPTAEDRRLLAQNERAAKAAVMAPAPAPKKFPPGQKPAAVTKDEKSDPLEDYYKNIFGDSWTSEIDVGTYEAASKLAEIRDKAIETGVTEKEAEAILSGKKYSRGVEDVFYDVLGSGPAQKFFAFGPVAKALGVADVYSKYINRSIVGFLGEKGLPKLDQFGVPTGERFMLAPEDEATFQDKINDPTYGWGKQFPLNSKEYVDLSNVPGLGAANKWIDRISGFTGDVFFASPETYFTGVGGIARKFLGAGLETIGQQTARRAASEIVDEGAAAAGKRAALEVGETLAERSMGLAGVTRRNALEELAAARLARTAAEETVTKVGARVAAGGLPEEAIIARTSAAAAEARIAAAEKKLAKANKDVAVLRPSGAYVGPQTRQAAAKTVLDIRDGARATVDTGQIIDANDITRAATPVELELARLTLEAIPEELASEIAVRGIQVLSKKDYAEAAKVLGYESGIKFKVPFAPPETAVIIPGTNKITKALGLGFSGLRNTMFGSKLGVAAVDFFLPVAGDSIVNNIELLTDWETALRTGKIKDATTGIIRKATPTELDDIARILNTDVQYRGLTTLRIKNYAPVVVKTIENQDPAVIAKVAPLLYAIDSKWTPALRALYESLDETELAFYKNYISATENMATDS